MATIGAFSAKKRRAVTAVLTTGNAKEAAAAAGVSYRTLIRWQSEPDFQAAVKDAQAVELGKATARLAGELAAAVATLAEINQDTEAKAGERIRAARAILDYYPRLAELNDLLARVEAIEQVLAGSKTE